MGLLDRLAKAVADQIVKAPNLPSGTGIMTEQQMRQAGGIAKTQYGYGTSTPLPRIDESLLNRDELFISIIFRIEIQLNYLARIDAHLLFFFDSA